MNLIKIFLIYVMILMAIGLVLKDNQVVINASMISLFIGLFIIIPIIIILRGQNDK